MNLDNILKKIQVSVPECLAAGVVDMETGMLLAIRTVDSHPREVVDLLAAATGELFQGDNVSAIESMFKRIRGVKDDGHYFQEIVIFSDNLLHLFQRCKKNNNTVLTTVCRKKANVGMVMVKARGLLDELDQAI